MTHVAIDIGASSGRLIIGERKNDRLSMTEVHRFANGFAEKDGTHYWDIDHLLTEIVKGLAEVKRLGYHTVTAAIDTWAVDYALVDREGRRLQEVISYRDSRTAGTIEKVTAHISKNELYRKTGIQFLPFNTLFQLYEEDPYKRKEAKHILLVPDYLGFCLTGRAATEVTNASTMQLLNVETGDFDEELLALLGIRREQFAPFIRPGEKLGALQKNRFPAFDLPDCDVYAVGSHDTASAIAGTPGSGDGWAYLSSGTWSLLGIEASQPITTEAAFQSNYTNEWGVFGTFRFLKNIMGMWIMQEVRRCLPVDYTFAEFVEEARGVAPYQHMIDVNDDRFLNPADMVMEIQDYCRETGQRVPESAGEVAMCVFSSLALSYAEAVQALEAITNQPVQTLHIVGGGANNALLNQMTADMAGIPVLAGPSEATAIGNVMMQMIAAGAVQTLAEGRQLIADSFPLASFTPEAIGQDEIKNKWTNLLTNQGGKQDDN